MKVVIGSTTAVATEPAEQASGEVPPALPPELKRELRALLAQMLVEDYLMYQTDRKEVTGCRVTSVRGPNPGTAQPQVEREEPR